MSHLPLLIDARTLAEHLDDPDLRVFDTTAYLRREVEGGPYTVESGAADYRAGHIPGAAFADLPGRLSDPASRFRFTLPPPSPFETEIGALGVGGGVHVVAYARESPMWATRLWWLLRYYGFDAVSVLDGGLGSWKEAGLPLAAGEEQHAPATFEARPRPDLVASLDQVRERLEAGATSTCLVNALTPVSFRGLGAYAYSRPGRIPGSVSVPAGALLDPTTYRFLDAATLTHTFDAAGVGTDDREILAYCGGGISATVDLFALHLIGRDGRLYDGSLTEWSADPELPLEVG